MSFFQSNAFNLQLTARPKKEWSGHQMCVYHVQVNLANKKRTSVANSELYVYLDRTLLGHYCKARCVCVCVWEPSILRTPKTWIS